MQPRWFEAAFGFAERDHEQTRDFVVRNVRQLPIGGDSVYPVPRLQFKRHNSDEWLECGHFEVLTVGQLRSAVDAAIEKLKLLRGAVPHEWRLLNAKGEAMALHADPSNAGAVFQVASQLNCLEFQHSRVVPEMGLTNYYRDKTQGPACAIACGAGLLYRQYVHRVKPSSAQLGQTKDNQINLLDSTEALLRALAPDKPRMPWVVRNGYVDADPAEWESWRAVLERESTLAALVDSMAVGVQWDTQVTLDQCSHLVTQVYTSAVPVAHSVVLTEEEWEPFARAVLCGAYEATLLTAVLNHLRAGSTGAARVFLTSVGGGAFGNPAKWIVEAMERAFLRVGAHFRSYVELHAVIVHHAWPPPAEFERFMHGGVAEPSSAGLPIMNSTPAPHSVAPPVLGCNKNPSTEAELPPATVSSVHPDKSTALMKQLQNADGASPNMVAHKARTSPAEPVPPMALSPAVLHGMQRSDDALARIASVDPPTETLRGGFTANIDGCRVELRLGDLTAEECDAIVVPTTKHLTHPSAVGAAILQAADANVLASDVRHALAARGGKLKPYDAVATASSGRLMCRCLIHSYVPLAAPSCDYQYAGNVEALCAAFSNILHLASEHALATVALPALGTGGGEYTHEECAAALATAVADHTRVALPGRRVTSVRAVFLSKPELDLFEAAFRATLQVLLPPTMALAAPPVRSVAPRTVSLCVATFNLLSEPNYQHHAKPPQVNVRQRLGAMPYLTAQLQGAQIISLQEVAPGCPISDAFAKQLGNHLEIIRSNARGEGPALAYNRATWSAEQPTFYPLNGHGTKGVICARMEPWDMLLFAPLIFVACHLPWFANDAEIREMLQKVHTHVNAYQRGHRRLPVVLAGDFNIDIRDSRTGPLLRAAFPPTHWEIVTGSLLMTSLSPHGQERVLDHIIVSRGESLTLEKTYTIPPYEERLRLVPHARPPAGPPSQPFVSDHMACVAVLKQ